MMWDPTELDKYIVHVLILQLYADVTNSDMISMNPKIAAAIQRYQETSSGS